MEEEDDDLYEPQDTTVPDDSYGNVSNLSESNVKMDTTEVGNEDEQEEEIEEDDSESEIEFITEKKDAPAKDESRETPAFDKSKSTPIRMSVDPGKAPTPTLKTESPVPTSTTPLKPGSEYPARHISTVDVNVDPVHPATGKPISQTDLDTDFPGDNDKPWRRPGADMTDYFNYGFDEFTWASYVLKQQNLRKDISAQKKEMEDMQNFFSSTGMPPMPGMPAPGAAAPTNMPGMPPLPELTPDLMNNMMGTMFSQGLDPTNMPPEDFMRYAQQAMQTMGQGGQQGFGGQGQMGGQQNQQQAGYGDSGFNQRGGRGRGRRWQ